MNSTSNAVISGSSSSDSSSDSNSGWKLDGTYINYPFAVVILCLAAFTVLLLSLAFRKAWTYIKSCCDLNMEYYFIDNSSVSDNRSTVSSLDNNSRPIFWQQSTSPVGRGQWKDLRGSKVMDHELGDARGSLLQTGTLSLLKKGSVYGASYIPRKCELYEQGLMRIMGKRGRTKVQMDIKQCTLQIEPHGIIGYRKRRMFIITPKTSFNAENDQIILTAHNEDSYEAWRHCLILTIESGKEQI